MKQIEIKLDVYGAWKDVAPAYRIYIDDEMICERGFYAMEYEFCQEKILVELPAGTSHLIKFEPLPTIRGNTLSYKNLRMNGIMIEPGFTVPN
jgi:hypothetical protein